MASTAKLSTGPTAAIRTPANAGPPNLVTESVAETMLLRLVSSDLGMMRGRNVALPTENTTPAKLTVSATPTSWTTLSTPKAYATGIDAIATALETSIITCVARRGYRCTRAPAG